jgi:hypothetical protein
MVKHWRLWLLVLAVIPLGACVYDEVFTWDWIGKTDLQIEFFVKDVSTGKPVEDATIEVIVEDGFYRERDEKEFKLVTGQDGMARRVCHDNKCCGIRSGLRFTDIFSVFLPGWRFKVSAPVFEPGGWVSLNSEVIGQPKRLGPGISKLVVLVAVKKTSG